MKAVIVIPARLESTRLERKLLLAETGKTLLQHTWEQAKKTGLDVIVATDSDEIYGIAQEFAGSDNVVITSRKCKNGTERAAEVAEDSWYGDSDVFVNWQGDEPEINPTDIDYLIENCARSEIWTMAVPITFTQALDVNRTKVVTNDLDEALYFSRERIPYLNPEQKFDHYWQHIGVYVYHKKTLHVIAGYSTTIYEELERLEQLRWMNFGKTIVVVPVKNLPEGINTRADYDAFVQRQKVMA